MRHVLVLALLLLSGCSIYNEDETQAWINSAKKPVIIYGEEKHNVGESGDSYIYSYTLIDSIGNVFFTGSIRSPLPPIIP